MKVSTIVVGQGLAGTCVAAHLEKNNIDFVVINEYEENCSSRVAAGVFNPITGKRPVKTWLADTIFPYAVDFYTTLEQQLGFNIIRHLNIYKPFLSAAEENDLVGKSSEPTFAKYLNLSIDNNPLSEDVINPFGGAEILHSGNVKLASLLDGYQEYLTNKGVYRNERFEYNALNISESKIVYKDIEADRIIFAEGYHVSQNPYFTYLPFAPTKGEILEIEIENFQSERIINRGGFVLPLENGKCLAGATYERNTDTFITKEGRHKVEEKINSFIKKPYEVTGQRAGVRPSTKDRRPIIGAHPELANVFLFNGLGTKGVTLGPYFANQLIDHILHGSELIDEVNISRYYSLYSSVSA